MCKEDAHINNTSQIDRVYQGLLYGVLYIYDASGMSAINPNAHRILVGCKESLNYGRVTPQGRVAMFGTDGRVYVEWTKAEGYKRDTSLKFIDRCLRIWSR